MYMKRYFILGLTLLGLSFSSCDFLDREPMDFGNESAYFKNPEDLKIFVNDYYSLFPKMESLWGGIYTVDNTSDNQIGNSISNLFYKGEKKTVNADNSDWKFKNLRGINYFIRKTEDQIAAGAMVGTEEFINHYLGEGYFFRAYEYFRLLRNYGDVPKIEEMLSDETEVLTAASKRTPRNEIARFILSDLDKAIELMMEKAPESGRLCKDVAYLLKARVALYEGTWEKYHAGTTFVPGNSKWVGATTYPDFKFVAGSAEAEYNFFFDQAIAAADVVASNRQLDTDYITMFNKLDPFNDNDEVILARYYIAGILSHSCSNYLGRTGAGTGLTRSMVNSYLMTNGLPIYHANSGYLGDKELRLEMRNRDTRLTNSVKIVSRISGDTIFYHTPQITLTGNEAATTGYDVKKYVSDVEGQQAQYQGTTATPIFRSAEAYLTYLEAYYERHGQLDGECDVYWKAVRIRAGVNPDYRATIEATDLAQENDLAVWSKERYVDKTLYNIRRERRCEFVAEGMRLDDLKRWRALDKMVDYQVEGLNLWEEMYKLYDPSTIGEGIVSQAGISKYIRPLQKSATGAAYWGYTFPKPHYLEPIPVTDFLLTTDKNTGKSTLYQNPGWPSEVDGIADYGFDCD